MAGDETTLVLTLTATETIEPKLNLDVFLAGGPLAAPLIRGASPELSRIGKPQPGVQRFQFDLKIPEVKARQTLVLRLRARIRETEGWLPLPTITIEAQSKTWPESLRRFVHDVPTARIYGAVRLDHLLVQAGVQIPQKELTDVSGDTETRVWLTEATETETFPTTNGLWIVFKGQVAGGLKLSRTLPDGPLYLTVDDSALAANQAAGQDLLERTLALARELLILPPKAQ